ncbi:MAG: endonuclease domain-containing protein [Pseudomonadota bacterium]
MKPLTKFAKQLRKDSTDTERFLWRKLRSKNLQGFKFRRQEPIGNYIVDFVCYETKVIIECDGGQHTLQKPTDNVRDEWLKKEGYNVLRFWNNEVLQNIEGVLEVILKACKDHPSPNPFPSREGEL